MKVDLLQHNQAAYEKIQEIFKTNNKTCIVQPTGSGKSYLMLKLVEDYINDNRDIVIIEPQRYIFDQLKEKMDKYGLPKDKMKFITYSALGKMDCEKVKKFTSPCMVIVDEMHRAGAHTWIKGIQLMFTKFPADCKYLGLSATPIRYLDGKRNMCEELFDGCVANEISLADAILNRILPLPRYIAGLYTYENEINELTRKIHNSSNTADEKKELLEKVKLMKRNLDKSEGISSIFQKYIVSDNGKYVAFCRDITHLKEMRECLEQWFSDVGIKADMYEVHYKNPNKNEDFASFKEDKNLAVCLSVGMLSEGVHGIDGVILLRDTVSPNLYYQQIGRAFAVEMESVPVIFDMVANCESVMDCGLKADLMKAIDKRDKETKDRVNIGDSGEITKEDIEKFFVFDQVLDAVSAFKEIEGRLADSWDAMFQEYCKFHEENGHGDVPEKYKKLGRWCITQRQDLKNGILRDYRKNMLDKNGFIWDVLRYRFENNVKGCIKFQNENGKLPSANSKDNDEKKLGVFIFNIRKEIKKNKKIPEWKINLLQQIPTFFDERKSGFDRFYENSLRYKERYGHVNIKTNDTINGYRIGSALNRLIEDYKKNKLTDEQIVKLRNLGINVTCGKYEHRFSQNMELARQALEKGVCISNSNQLYENVNLYTWHMENKNKFSNRELEIMNKLIPSNKRPIKIIEATTGKVLVISQSISEAGRILYHDFHVANSEEKGFRAIYQRLINRTKNPIYKGRFRFEYAEDTTA